MAAAEPLKIGLIAEPPSLIVVYKMWGRLRMRKVPLRNLWPSSSTSFILEDIRTRHDILLGVPDEAITKMIDALKAVKGGKGLSEAIGEMEKRRRQTKEADGFSPVECDKGTEEKEAGDVNQDKKGKPYSFMDKKLADEDTDFDPNDDLPLDTLEGNSDDEFWR